MAVPLSEGGCEIPHLSALQANAILTWMTCLLLAVLVRRNVWEELGVEWAEGGYHSAVGEGRSCDVVCMWCVR